MQSKVHMLTLVDKDQSLGNQMPDGENLQELIGTFQSVVILEDIQHMVYFHLMIGQLVQKDNGGNQHMTMDMKMNIMNLKMGMVTIIGMMKMVI